MSVLAVERAQGDLLTPPAGAREARTAGQNVLRGIRPAASMAGGARRMLAQGSRIIELAVLGLVSSIPGGLEAVSTTSSRTGNKVIG